MMISAFMLQRNKRKNIALWAKCIFRMRDLHIQRSRIGEIEISYSGLSHSEVELQAVY